MSTVSKLTRKNGIRKNSMQSSDEFSLQSLLLAVDKVSNSRIKDDKHFVKNCLKILPVIKGVDGNLIDNSGTTMILDSALVYAAFDHFVCSNALPEQSIDISKPHSSWESSYAVINKSDSSQIITVSLDSERELSPLQLDENLKIFSNSPLHPDIVNLCNKDFSCFSPTVCIEPLYFDQDLGVIIERRPSKSNSQKLSENEDLFENVTQSPLNVNTKISTKSSRGVKRRKKRRPLNARKRKICKKSEVSLIDRNENDNKGELSSTMESNAHLMTSYTSTVFEQDDGVTSEQQKSIDAVSEIQTTQIKSPLNTDMSKVKHHISIKNNISDPVQNVFVSNESEGVKSRNLNISKKSSTVKTNLRTYVRTCKLKASLKNTDFIIDKQSLDTVQDVFVNNEGINACVNYPHPTENRNVHKIDLHSSETNARRITRKTNDCNPHVNIQDFDNKVNYRTSETVNCVTFDTIHNIEEISSNNEILGSTDVYKSKLKSSKKDPIAINEPDTMKKLLISTENEDTDGKVLCNPKTSPTRKINIYASRTRARKSKLKSVSKNRIPVIDRQDLDTEQTTSKSIVKKKYCEEDHTSAKSTDAYKINLLTSKEHAKKSKLEFPSKHPNPNIDRQNFETEQSTLISIENENFSEQGGCTDSHKLNLHDSKTHAPKSKVKTPSKNPILVMDGQDLDIEQNASTCIENKSNFEEDRSSVKSIAVHKLNLRTSKAHAQKSKAKSLSKHPNPMSDRQGSESERDTLISIENENRCEEDQTNAKSTSTYKINVRASRRTHAQKSKLKSPSKHPSPNIDRQDIESEQSTLISIENENDSRQDLSDPQKLNLHTSKAHAPKSKVKTPSKNPIPVMDGQDLDIEQNASTSIENKSNFEEDHSSVKNIDVHKLNLRTSKAHAQKSKAKSLSKHPNPMSDRQSSEPEQDTLISIENENDCEENQTNAKNTAAYKINVRASRAHAQKSKLQSPSKHPSPNIDRQDIESEQSTLISIENENDSRQDLSDPQKLNLHASKAHAPKSKVKTPSKNPIPLMDGQDLDIEQNASTSIENKNNFEEDHSSVKSIDVHKLNLSTSKAHAQKSKAKSLSKHPNPMSDRQSSGPEQDTLISIENENDCEENQTNAKNTAAYKINVRASRAHAQKSKLQSPSKHPNPNIDRQDIESEQSTLISIENENNSRQNLSDPHKLNLHASKAHVPKSKPKTPSKNPIPVIDRQGSETEQSTLISIENEKDCEEGCTNAKSIDGYKNHTLKVHAQKSKPKSPSKHPNPIIKRKGLDTEQSALLRIENDCDEDCTNDHKINLAEESKLKSPSKDSIIEKQGYKAEQINVSSKIHVKCTLKSLEKNYSSISDKDLDSFQSFDLLENHVSLENSCEFNKVDYRKTENPLITTESQSKHRVLSSREKDSIAKIYPKSEEQSRIGQDSYAKSQNGFSDSDDDLSQSRLNPLKLDPIKEISISRQLYEDDLLDFEPDISDLESNGHCEVNYDDLESSCVVAKEQLEDENLPFEIGEGLHGAGEVLPRESSNKTNEIPIKPFRKDHEHPIKSSNASNQFSVSSSLESCANLKLETTLSKSEKLTPDEIDVTKDVDMRKQCYGVRTSQKRKASFDADDSDSDSEHSFKRRTDTMPKYQDMNGIQKRQCTTSNSKLAMDHVDNVRTLEDVLENIRLKCANDEVDTAVDMATNFVRISEDRAAQINIFEELFISIMCNISSTKSVPEDALDKAFSAFYECELYNRRLNTLIITEYFKSSLTVSFAVDLCKHCRNNTIPVDKRAIEAYSNYAESKNVPRTMLLDFLQYVKDVCKLDFPKSILQEVVKRVLERAKDEESCLHPEFRHLCRLLCNLNASEVKNCDLKKFLETCIKNNCWKQIANFFHAWSTKGYLLNLLKNALAFRLEDIGLFFEKFADEVFSDADKLTQQSINVFGQIGVRLMLNVYRKGHPESAKNKKSELMVKAYESKKNESANSANIYMVNAFEIMYTLSRHGINYFELQEPLQSVDYAKKYINALPNPSEVLLFPFTVAFTAVDICFELQRPKDAYQVIQSYRHVVPEGLDNAIKLHVKLQHFQYLLDLIQLLQSVDPLDRGLNAFHDLLTALEEDISLTELQNCSEINLEVIDDIYNQYLVTLMNKQQISSVFELYEHSIGPRKGLFKLKSEVLRGLVVTFSQHNKIEEANKVFLLGKMQQVYEFEKPQLGALPWILTIASLWTTGEIKLVIESYIKTLLSVLSLKEQETDFETWFTLKIVFTESPFSPSKINCLMEPLASNEDALRRTCNVLYGIDSKLTWTEQDKCLILNHGPIYNYFCSNFPISSNQFIALTGKKRFLFGNDKDTSRLDSVQASSEMKLEDPPETTHYFNSNGASNHLPGEVSSTSDQITAYHLRNNSLEERELSAKRRISFGSSSESTSHTPEGKLLHERFQLSGPIETCSTASGQMHTGLNKRPFFGEFNYSSPDSQFPSCPQNRTINDNLSNFVSTKTASTVIVPKSPALTPSPRCTLVFKPIQSPNKIIGLSFSNQMLPPSSCPVKRDSSNHTLVRSASSPAGKSINQSTEDFITRCRATTSTSVIPKSNVSNLPEDIPGSSAVLNVNKRFPPRGVSSLHNHSPELSNFREPPKSKLKTRKLISTQHAGVLNTPKSVRPETPNFQTSKFIRIGTPKPYRIATPCKNLKVVRPATPLMRNSALCPRPTMSLKSTKSQCTPISLKSSRSEPTKKKLRIPKGAVKSSKAKSFGNTPQFKNFTVSLQGDSSERKVVNKRLNKSQSEKFTSVIEPNKIVKGESSEKLFEGRLGTNHISPSAILNLPSKSKLNSAAGEDFRISITRNYEKSAKEVSAGSLCRSNWSPSLSISAPTKAIQPPAKVQLRQTKKLKISCSSDVPDAEFQKIVTFLSSKVLQKCRDSSPAQQRAKAKSLAQTFIETNIISRLDRRTMKLLSDFADQRI